MADVPGRAAVNAIADAWGFEHGFFWCFISLFVAILFAMLGVISTKSGLVGTGAGALVLVIANTQGVCPVWVTIAFVFMGITLSWASSRVYS